MSSPPSPPGWMPPRIRSPAGVKVAAWRCNKKEKRLQALWEIATRFWRANHAKSCRVRMSLDGPSGGSPTVTPQPSAGKKACRHHSVVSPPGLQLATCTVPVWSVCSFWGYMPALLTELQSENRNIIRFSILNAALSLREREAGVPTL